MFFRRLAFIALFSMLLTACRSAVFDSILSPTAEPTMTPHPPATPSPADHFDFPLDPNRFGPYVYNVTGPLNVDTRYGVQNPGLVMRANASSMLAAIKCHSANSIMRAKTGSSLMRAIKWTQVLR